MQKTDERTETLSKSEALWKRREQWVPRGISTYTHIAVKEAHGAEVIDLDGRRYIDFAGGIGTINAGHTPEGVVEAIRDQAGKLIHMAFGVAIYEPYIDLAQRLAEIVPGPTAKKTLLVNSGAEAVENAVKIARSATGRENIIAFNHSFHGRTILTLTLTGRDQPYKQGFGPFAPGVFHTSYPNAYRCPSELCHHNGGHEDCAVESGRGLEEMLENQVPADNVAAILIEPVLGEGGFVAAPPAFLQRLREICDRTGILLIADEIQTGFGRTGKMFAIEHSGIEPDIMVLAKSLSAGLPLAAIVGKADIMDAPTPGGIGGTFGGNPVACRGALAVIDLFERENLVERGQEIGQIILDRFHAMQRKYEIIGDVRGLGAMVAIELVRNRDTKEPAKEETSEIIHRCHDEGLIIIKAGGLDNVVRVLVPLVATHEQVEAGLKILEGQIAAVSQVRI